MNGHALRSRLVRRSHLFCFRLREMKDDAAATIGAQTEHENLRPARDGADDTLRDRHRPISCRFPDVVPAKAGDPVFPA